MIAITHFSVESDDVFAPALELALTTLAARPGYVRGSAGRSTDGEGAWVLVTEWRTVGDYRRALGNYDVKLYATPVLAQAVDLPGAFEQLVTVERDGTVTRVTSDLAYGERIPES